MIRVMNGKTLTLSLLLACASAASATCPPAATTPSATPALDALKASAASGDMSAVTGDGCAQTPGSSAAGKKDPAAAADAKKTPAPKTQEVPTVTDQAPASDGPSFFSKVKGFFSDIPVNQTMAGVGFGAGIGILAAIIFASPVGWFGGALIGAAVGAVLFSGVIGKLFGGGGTGGS
jgi:hypothetical protein